ncbi:hypothetical protein UFOVP116_154 [uncultured Caudovirales phage]|uniref:Uncharacterized protein n=1 Tax=uncultured Caudovirales phage TaxID=2100421 RepID=A0A6J5LE03_9CAUD|nr:hypothetical protein UFOVP116_154 [uncultured Caudovirales phage]
MATSPKNSIKLNRKQIEKLIEVFNNFKDVPHFDVHVDRSSGIGVGIQISFGLFSEKDTTIDITDYDSW